MTLTLYFMPSSPPVRAVRLTAKALGLDLKLEFLDVLKGEQFKPEYLKLNPEHTIPTLIDNDFVIWDSHAIMGYLVNKYGKDDRLYPNEPCKRAVIDQRLHFETGNLFPKLISIAGPILFKGKTTISEENKIAVKQSYDLLEKFLLGRKWIAGDDVSIADFSLLTTVTSLNTVIPLNDKKHANVIEWIKEAEKLPYYSPNAEGLEVFKELVTSKVTN